MGQIVSPNGMFNKFSDSTTLHIFCRSTNTNAFHMNSFKVTPAQSITWMTKASETTSPRQHPYRATKFLHAFSPPLLFPPLLHFPSLTPRLSVGPHSIFRYWPVNGFLISVSRCGSVTSTWSPAVSQWSPCRSIFISSRLLCRRNSVQTRLLLPCNHHTRTSNLKPSSLLTRTSWPKHRGGEQGKNVKRRS